MRLLTQEWQDNFFASYECANDHEDFTWFDSDYYSSDTENKNSSTFHANDVVMTPNADPEVGTDDEDDKEVF